MSSSINDSKRVKRMEDDGRSGHPKMQRVDENAKKREILFRNWGQKFNQAYYLEIVMTLHDSLHSKCLKSSPTIGFFILTSSLWPLKIYYWTGTLPSFTRFGSQWLFALFKIEVPPEEMKNFWTSKMFRKCDSSTEGFIKKQSSINVSNSGSIATQRM